MKARGRLWLPIILAAMLQPGCSDDPSDVCCLPGPVRILWYGSWTSDDQSDHGTMVLDVVDTGSELTGEIVIRSGVDDDLLRHMYMTGVSNGGVLQLRLDTDKVPYQYEFNLEGSIGSGPVLEGTFTHSVYDLAASFQCRGVEVGGTTVESSMNLHTNARGLAFDGSRIWLSTTSSDFIRMDTAGSILDTIAVFIRPDVHWTSDALTSDGTHLWGHLPMTIVSDVSRNVSDIQEFTTDGVIVRDFRLGHRTSGLAVAGEGWWSLPLESDTLYRFDDTGTILESVEIELPDLVDIDYDGEHFWCIGWFLKRLYKVDGAGTVVRAYDLPAKNEINFPAAIVSDGTHLWYGYDNILTMRSSIYRLSVH
jgi:hypothetical protein